MENIRILGLAVLLERVLRHLHEQPLLRIDDTQTVNGKGTADIDAGNSLDLRVFVVHEAVDPSRNVRSAALLLFRRSLCVGFLGCHDWFLLLYMG